MDSGSSPGTAVADEPQAKPATASTSSLPALQVQPPPITVMMQQAIAMQQFQFQQALLMQQVMQSQQAAARAATVKSAAEMAAARAAEISKQLKRTDASEENEKVADPSPGRSKARSSSRSVSHSRSRSRSRLRSRSRSRLRSRSRSRSRSPIRYRRDRSFSGSPIRYRRDRYSPTRYRDYYGYHSRSRYRGSYRGGRGDYYRSYYRREWDWDRGRDFVSSRRSRSRSRSRVRRRSRTHSPSPKYRKGHSQSPKYRREDSSVVRRSRCSRSREGNQSLSRSRSLSGSRDCEIAKKEAKVLQKGSSAQKSKDGDGPNLSNVHSDSMDTEHTSTRRSLRHLNRTAKKEKLNINQRTGTPDSPVRSLSVSLELPTRKTEKKHRHEYLDSTRHSRKLSHHMDSVIAADEVQPSMEEQVLGHVLLQSKAEDNDMSLAPTNEHEKGNTSFSLSNEHHETAELLEIVNKKGPAHKLETSDEEMQDEEFDDWRDDIKSYAKEKAKRKEIQGEGGKNKRESKREDLQQHAYSSVEECNDNEKEFTQLSSDSRTSQEIHHEGALDKRTVPDSDYSPQKDAYIGIKPAPYSESEFVDLASKVNIDEFKENGNIGGTSEGGTKEGSCQFSDCEDKEGELVYEGPKLAAIEYIYNRQHISPLKHVESKAVMDGDEYKQDSLHSADSTGKYKENLGMQSKHMIDMADDEDMSHKQRRKERAVHKEEHEKHKDRHKKHRRKHRREMSTEHDDNADDDDNEIDNDDNVNGEAHKGKKHRRRKHRRDDEERRERRKRRHRHRAKAFSSSRSQSLALDGKDKDEALVSSSQRKSSSRHRRRFKETSKSPFSNS